MNETTFYQALKQCFINKQNCSKCPLYAYGMRKNDQCIKALADEIDERKFNAHIEQDKED